MRKSQGVGGWIKMHRAITDHWIWNFDTPEKALAWIDLLLMARHTDGKIMLKNKVVLVRRGEVGMSQIALQKRWKWSQNKVKRFLKMLESDLMIEFRTNEVTTIISICNFDSYQCDETQSERTIGSTNERPVERSTDDQSNEDIRREEGKNNTYTSQGDSETGAPAPGTPPCPHGEIVGLYHELLPELPPVKDLTASRQKSLRARWRSHSRFQNVDWWRAYFMRVGNSDFLMGRAKDWQADFDFLIRPSKFQKIIEGGYQNGAA